jgi:hypothetical protein
MKSSYPADAQSAPTNYAPSVPMTVYRELAAELRANKAVIDSLNSRNQQLLNQNQMLKQEIHNVVQATLSLGQAAGIARQASANNSALSGASAEPLSARTVPNALVRLARGETQPAPEAPYEHPMPPAAQHYAQAIPQAIPQAMPQAPRSPSAAPATSRNRVPRPIGQKPAPRTAPRPAQSSAQKQMSQAAAKSAARDAREASHRNAVRQQAVSSKSAMAQTSSQKLFTEKSGEYRSAVLEASENKEIGGIWLALSIILIIVTAFGAGFLIMKPLLNDR